MSPKSQTELRSRLRALWPLVRYFLYLGSWGFGGPIALVGYMEKHLVEDRKWITREEYLRGLALANLCPGPVATQLAIYIGYVRGKVLGATLVALAFLAPPLTIVAALAVGYVRYGRLPNLEAFLYGIGACVVAIVLCSALRLARLALGGRRLLWSLAAASAVLTWHAQAEVALVFILSGVAAWAVYAPPKSLARLVPKAGKGAWALVPMVSLHTGLAGPASTHALAQMLLVFFKAGAFVFGTGLAILPFLYSDVVVRYGWLTERQFVDAVGVGLMTPGPVMVGVAFIGYLAAGPAGAGVAALATFLPVYLMTLAAAPWIERFEKNRPVRAFVEGVTAAAVGAIAASALVIARKAVPDLPAGLLALASLVLLVRFRVPEPALLLACGLAGILISCYNY